MVIATSFGMALGISLVLVPACRAIARWRGLVAGPKNDRWHRQPTALLGGVGIAVALFGSLAATHTLGGLRVLAGCGLLIFLVGLTDDLISLKPSTKLVAEIALASVFLTFGYRLHWTNSPAFDSVLTIAWVVGITNAFNLLDNMDGLCAGVTVIAGAAFLLGLMPIPSEDALFHARYTAALVGAVLGFLVFNVHPASIFMGDSGSLLIGMSFAGLTVGSIPGMVGKANLLSIMAAPLMVLLIPIFDTTLVTFSRLLSGRDPSIGGRDHSSHRLVAIGLSEKAAVRLLWLLAALGGMIGLAAKQLTDAWIAVPVVLFVLAMAIFAAYLGHVRVYEDGDAAESDRSRLTPLVANFMHKRHMAEVLLDLCLVPIAYYAAYRIRFEGVEFEQSFPSFLQSLPLVVGTQMVALFVVGGYRGVWRYFGLMDAVVFGKGVLLGVAGAELLILVLYRFAHYSRTVFVIHGMLLMMFLTTSRASFRLIGEYIHRRRQAGHRVVIYGAGDAGALVARQLATDPHARYRIIGFADDDARKARLRVQGFPILGGLDAVVSLISTGAVEAVVLSASVIDVDRLRFLEDRCQAHGVALSRLNFELERLVDTSADLEAARAASRRPRSVS